MKRERHYVWWRARLLVWRGDRWGVRVGTWEGGVKWERKGIHGVWWKARLFVTEINVCVNVWGRESESVLQRAQVWVLEREYVCESKCVMNKESGIVCGEVRCFVCDGERGMVCGWERVMRKCVLEGEVCRVRKREGLCVLESRSVCEESMYVRVKMRDEQRGLFCVR